MKLVFPRFKGHVAFVLAFLLMGTAIASTPLYAEGWFISHDIAPHLLRIFATCHEVRLGDLYPRWLSLALYGKGLPDLNFYSPAFYLVVSWLHVLGIPLSLALKALCFSLSFLGALGTYFWVKKYTNAPGALISATLYLFIPYRLLDLYVRGALPEFAALSLLPWLFYAIDRSFSADKARLGIFLTALISAAIVVTHHLSAIIVMPFGLAYFGWHVVAARSDKRKLRVALLGPLAGAGLSAFYWLPVVTEMKHLAYFENPVSVWDHFVYPPQWFDSKWDFGLSVPGPEDGMSFQIGVVLISTVLLAIPTLFWMPRQARKFGLVFLGLGSLGLFLTAHYSSTLYELIYPLQLIQFPWRFLGPATLFLVAFSGLATTAPWLEKFSWFRWALLAVVFVASVNLSSGQRAVRLQEAIDLDALEKETIATRQVGGKGMAREFMPKWANFDPDIAIKSTLRVEPSQYLGAISHFQTKGATMTFSVAADQTLTLTVPWYYFPGWQATANGSQILVATGQDGFITFNLPPGVHKVKIWFGSTWPRTTGWIAALTTLFLLLMNLTMKRQGYGMRVKFCRMQESESEATRESQDSASNQGEK